MFWQEKSSKLIWIFALTWKFKKIYLNLCFDKGNQSNQYLQVAYHIFLNLLFDSKNPENWVEISDLTEKSNEFFCICVLTGKIQQIDLNFCFDMKIQKKYLNLCFWQSKSIWSILSGYVSFFFKLNLLFDRKNPKNWVEFIG